MYLVLLLLLLQHLFHYVAAENVDVQDLKHIQRQADLFSAWKMKELYERFTAVITDMAACDITNKRHHLHEQKEERGGFQSVLFRIYPNCGSTWLGELTMIVRGVFMESIYPNGKIENLYGTYSDTCCSEQDCRLLHKTKYNIRFKDNETFYNAPWMKENGNGCRGLRDGSKTALIKTHSSSKNMNLMDKRVTVLRNPIDVPDANFNWLSRYGVTRDHMENGLSHDFIMHALKDYLTFHWILAFNMQKDCTESLIITYEELQLFPRPSLIKIFDFIGVPYTYADIDRAIRLSPPHPLNVDSNMIYFNYFILKDMATIDEVYEMMNNFTVKIENKEEPPTDYEFHYFPGPLY